MFARKGTVLIEEGSENSALFVVGLQSAFPVCCQPRLQQGLANFRSWHLGHLRSRRGNRNSWPGAGDWTVFWHNWRKSALVDHVESCMSVSVFAHPDSRFASALGEWPMIRSIST